MSTDIGGETIAKVTPSSRIYLEPSSQARAAAQKNKKGEESYHGTGYNLGKPIGHSLKDVSKKKFEHSKLCQPEMTNCNISAQCRETFIQFHMFVNVETVVQSINHVNALHIKTHAVRTVRLATGLEGLLQENSNAATSKKQQWKTSRANSQRQRWTWQTNVQTSIKFSPKEQ